MKTRLDKIVQLFVIAHANALNVIENDRDKLFLENQIKPDCLDCTIRLEKIFL